MYEVHVEARLDDCILYKLNFGLFTKLFVWNVYDILWDDPSHHLPKPFNTTFTIIVY